MTTELAPLFEPIVARFDVQSQTIAALRAEIARLQSNPGPTPAPPPPDPDFTVFAPPDTGARVVYVSSSTGLAANSGLSPDAPVDTLARGVSLLRDGAGDRLLLKAGDTFRESFGSWTRSGRSPQQPLLISAYGDGPRPRVVSATSALSVLSADVHDLALVGLHLTAAGRDPASPDFDPASPSAPAGHGVRLVRPVTNLLVEDCRIDHFVTNLTLTPGDAPGAKVSNVTIRRCIIVDAWSASGAFSGQGLYASGCDGLLIEDNVFDHNGWNQRIPQATANIFRHNLYVSAANTNVTVRGNVIASGSSHGIQLRCGGVVEENLFVDNAIHALLCGAAGRFRRNVVLGGRDIDAANPRGFGLTLACADGRAEHNVFAHKPASTGCALLLQRNEWTPAGPMHATLLANVVYGWGGNGLDVNHDADVLEFVGNDLQPTQSSRKLLNIKAKVGRLLLAANRYGGPDHEREKSFSRDGAYIPPQRWFEQTGDTSRLERVRYRHPSCALPADYIDKLRNRPRGAWDPSLAASATAASFRHAFQPAT